MQLILKQNSLDDSMVELRDKDNNLLYAVFHADLIYEDENLRNLVKTGGRIKCQLTAESDKYED